MRLARHRNLLAACSGLPLPVLIVSAASSAQNAGPEDSKDDGLGDEFLGALTALGGSAGNGRLQSVLEWDDATYEAIKEQLLLHQAFNGEL